MNYQHNNNYKILTFEVDTTQFRYEATAHSCYYYHKKWYKMTNKKFINMLFLWNNYCT